MSIRGRCIQKRFPTIIIHYALAAYCIVHFCRGPALRLHFPILQHLGCVQVSAFEWRVCSPKPKTVSKVWRPAGGTLGRVLATGRKKAQASDVVQHQRRTLLYLLCTNHKGQILLILLQLLMVLWLNQSHQSWPILPYIPYGSMLANNSTVFSAK